MMKKKSQPFLIMIMTVVFTSMFASCSNTKEYTTLTPTSQTQTSKPAENAQPQTTGLSKNKQMPGSKTSEKPVSMMPSAYPHKTGSISPSPTPYVTSPTPDGNQQLPENQKQLLDNIIAKYRAQAVSLKNQNLSKLEGLAQKAAAEYESYAPEERSTNKSKVYSKYLSQALNLQASCDSQFHQITANMRDELVKNNLPLYPVDDAINQYSSEKQSAMSSLSKKFIP